ncbi:uncharacterized protein LOC144646924 isoform X3 [Oculina patagonica]
MERVGSLLITELILQCIVLSLANQNLVPMFISEIDTFLDTDRDIVSEGSVFACVKRCAETSGCKSINYKKQGAGNNCHLNKKNRREAGEAAVETNDNFVHYTIDYHTQRSEEPEFGTTNIDMPVIPPIVIGAADASPITTAPPTTTPAAPPTTTAAPPTTPAAPPTTTAAPPGLCDSNPCQNGGACTEVSAENRYKCSCTALFTGTNCEQAVSPPTTQPPTTAPPAPPPSGACDSSPCKNGATCSEDGNGFKCSCANAFTGSQCDQPFSDFELIFRGTETINYVTRSSTNWFIAMTACAWIYTPGIAENQNMTVFSLMTVDNNSNKKVITEQIDGQGGFYFSFGDDRRNEHPGHFSSTSPKDSWIFLCVRFRNSQPYMEAIVNADFGSSASSNDFPSANVQLTKIVIGRDQDDSGNVINTNPFEGKISALNIWRGYLDNWNMEQWYQNGQLSYQPDYKWPSFGNPGNRVGNVHYVSVTSAGRTWRSVTKSELVINQTSNVMTATYDDGNGVVVETSQISSVPCSDQASAPVDGLVISVTGAWKRIAFEQIFLETQQCYAIFGSVPSWASGYNPGVEEFDPNEDEIWKAEFLGVGGVHEYSGVNTLCGSMHFWMVNHPQGNTPTAGISLRSKWGAQNAGISTFGKCGSFKFKIKNIKVLN